MSRDEQLALIRRYYDGCSRGDVGTIVSALHEDVVHYFLAPNVGSAPVSGAEHLARYWRKVQAAIDGRWIVDSIVSEDECAIIEWTMFWRSSAGAPRVATRGAEAYRFADGRIIEIRAYYQQHGDRSSELEGFPYATRGYSTLDAEHSAIDPG